MGLLDSLQDPNNALGLSLLAAGSPTTDPNQAGFGSRLNAAVVDATDKTLKQQLAASQLLAARQKAQLLGLAMGDVGAAPVGSPGAVVGAPAQAQAGAAGSPGAVVAPSAVPQGVGGAGAPSSAAAGLFNPRTAALLKLGGEADILPNIQAMQPKWEIHDGVAIDVNPLSNPSFKGGPQGFISKSADGKVIQGAVGADGQLHVAPVDGAVAAFNQFENASNQSKARNTESRQPVIGPTGREVSQSVYDAVNGATPPAAIGRLPIPGDPGTLAVMQQESGGNPAAVSSKGARGTMQVMPARDNSPAELQRVGQDYWGALNQKYGSAPLAAIAYNMGPGATDKWLAAGADFNSLPAETQKYVGGVMTRTDLNKRAAVTAPPLIGAAGQPVAPSPIVANSGAPAIGPARTNFLATPGTGVGVGGGTKFSPVEQAAQAAAKSGAEKQATLTAEAENTPNAIMANDYKNVSNAAEGSALRIQSLENMLGISKGRGTVSQNTPGPVIGLVPSNVSSDIDSYNKNRANVIQNLKSPSDKALENVQTMVPEYGVSQGAQQHAIEQMIGQERAAQVTNQILSPHVAQGAAGGAPYVAAKAVLQNNLTPAVASVVSPILSMAKSPARDAAIQAARKDPAAEAVLRAAIQSGALK
jgi:Transglycosylase SLT domain